ncbi:MAG TPA: hypothetical protein VGL66_11980 [Caulobacteraceae bacterium]|jgi:hypothetical protein
MSLNRWAAVATGVVGVYLEAVEWLDLYPWTTSFAITHGDNGQQSLDIIVGVVLAAMTAALWFAGRIAYVGRIVALISAALLAVWLWFQVQTWWIPYFTGASPGWAKTWAKWFSGTTQILPHDPHHLPPDANHFVLQLILLSAIGLCLATALTPRPARSRLGHTARTGRAF